jgi:hypothetical protein
MWASSGFFHGCLQDFASLSECIFLRLSRAFSRLFLGFLGFLVEVLQGFFMAQSGHLHGVVFLFFVGLFLVFFLGCFEACLKALVGLF